MLLLPGAPALSAFRLEKLLCALRAIDPGVATLAAHFHHFVDLARPLTADETRVLERLVESDVAPPPPPAGARLVVMPRPGTISPWSSKATDIAHVCGLGGGAAHRARHALHARACRAPLGRERARAAGGAARTTG